MNDTKEASQGAEPAEEGQREGDNRGDGGKLSARPEPPPPRERRVFWQNLLTGILIGVTVVAFSGVVPLTNKLAVLEERINTLKNDHAEDLERLEKAHEKDLKDHSCQLYDQALEGFGQDCIAEGGQPVSTACNYTTPVQGKRAKVFREPIQGLGRLCAGER